MLYGVIVAQLTVVVKNAELTDRGGHGIGAQLVRNGMIKEGETIEQCELCLPRASARTCVFGQSLLMSC